MKTTPRLFHFSDDDSIERFEPRVVSVVPERTTATQWLNGPMVWAIDEWHQPMYLFPRDCPRILLWCTAKTSNSDAHAYLGDTDARMIAYVEERWMARLETERLYRYELPTPTFQDLDDAGMWISKTAVVPLKCNQVRDLPTRLLESNVELRSLEVLSPLQELRQTSLHISGIRLRNAVGWKV